MRQVCARAALGMSVEATAHELGISPSRNALLRKLLLDTCICRAP